MRRVLACLMLFAAPVPGWAQPDKDFARGYALAMDKGCFECHALGRNEVGPAFRAIAQRYRFDSAARERLPNVVLGGSAGHWGERFVMWPQTQLSAEEVRELVDWVLSQQ